MSFYQDYSFTATGVALVNVGQFGSAANGTQFTKITGEVWEKTATGLYKKITDPFGVKIDENQTFTKSQRGDILAVTSSSNSIALDMDDSNYFSHIMTENTNLANPAVMEPGQAGSIFITQAAGLYTMSFGSYWGFPGKIPPTISDTDAFEDRLDYVVKSATKIDTIWSGDVGQ